MNKKLVLSLALAAAMTGCINDADVPSVNGDNPVPEVGKGNITISFVIPNSSNGSRADGTVEDSGIYDQGTAEEYKVNHVTLYLFDSESKNLAVTIKVNQSDLGTGTAAGGDGKDGQTIVYPCTKEITVKPGTYDILAVANGSETLNVGQLSTLLNHIDKTTYGNSIINSVPANGFVMTNRGSANMNVSVKSPENSDERTHVRINLERVVAKLMVRNAEQETYTLTNPDNVAYATVRLNNYKFVNLANKFYTFRHVATLDDAAETPSAPAAYSVENGNFGNIAAGNGYLIDPYFFNKTMANAETVFEGGNHPFYINYLRSQTDPQEIDNGWSGLAANGEYVTIYSLENCMFRPVQNTVYTTGIMLKGTFTPATEQTIGDDGRPVEDPLNFETLYYFNYKFYTSLDAVANHGDANIDGLSPSSSDDVLEKKQIYRFKKSGGNFSTYYNYWIKHFDNGNPSIMGVMEFGVVRNNIYKVNITGIKNLGPGTPDTRPNPDEYKALLTVEFGVYPWIVRDQDATLE